MATGQTGDRGRFVDDLTSLGLASGDVVLFHSSLKRIGWVEPGPEAVVEALLDVVGPAGTVVVPTLVPTSWAVSFSAVPMDVRLLGIASTSATAQIVMTVRSPIVMSTIETAMAR